MWNETVPNSLILGVWINRILKWPLSLEIYSLLMLQDCCDSPLMLQDCCDSPLMLQDQCWALRP